MSEKVKVWRGALNDVAPEPFEVEESYMREQERRGKYGTYCSIHFRTPEDAWESILQKRLQDVQSLHDDAERSMEKAVKKQEEARRALNEYSSVINNYRAGRRAPMETKS